MKLWCAIALFTLIAMVFAVSAEDKPDTQPDTPISPKGIKDGKPTSEPLAASDATAQAELIIVGKAELGSVRHLDAYCAITKGIRLKGSDELPVHFWANYMKIDDGKEHIFFIKNPVKHALASDYQTLAVWDATPEHIEAVKDLLAKAEAAHK